MNRLTRNIALGLSAFCMTGVTIGQQESDSFGESIEMTIIAGDGLAAPMIFSSSESFGGGEMSAGVRMMAAPAEMTFVGGLGGGIVSGGMPGMASPDPWGMLSNPSVQKDLELVGDQLQQVRDLQSQFAAQIQDQIGNFSEGGFTPDRLKDLPELIKKIRANQQEQMKELLLPHQIQRLQQVALQTHLQQAGTAGALASEKLAEELGITDEQKERLKTRSEEINKKLQEDMEKLKEQAREDILKELTKDQRTKLEEMTGNKYKPQPGDWAESFNQNRRKSMNRD